MITINEVSSNSGAVQKLQLRPDGVWDGAKAIRGDHTARSAANHPCATPGVNHVLRHDT